MKRRCAICDSTNKSHELYSFDELLRDLQIKGKHAHPICIMDAQAKLREQIRKQGRHG